MKAIQFQSYKSKVINIARANTYSDGLLFEPLPSDRLTQVSKYLMMNHKPILCVTPVFVVDSSLHTARKMTKGAKTFVIKDIAGIFMKHESERSSSFLLTVLDQEKIYFSGILLKMLQYLLVLE